MKRTSILLGIGVLAVVLLSFRARHKCDEHKHKRDNIALNAHFKHLFEEGLQLEEIAANLAVEDIHVVEMEEEIELGFDVADYLPEGFDAYQGMEKQLKNNSATHEELLSQKEIQQLFAEGIRLETEAANLKAADIHVIEVGEDIDLGMEIIANLPENVDPYQGLDPKLEDFLYQWMEEEVGLGIDIDDSMGFLAELFYPFNESIQTLTMDDIHVIELEEEIDLGINVADYLPRNFDPYAK